MRAMVVNEFGPPESIGIEERAEPEPGPGQVRIRVEAVLADDRATAVTVAVRKLRPPVPHHLDTCGVRIRRTPADLA